MKMVKGTKEEPTKLLRRAFEGRWRGLLKRTEQLDPPDKEELWGKVGESWESGFRCTYCGRPMKIKDGNPGLDVFSLDHRVPLDSGGDNSIENFAIAHKRCNTLKGTLPASVFEQVLRGEAVIPAEVSMRMAEFFKLGEDGWTSGYGSVDRLLKHLGRRSKSELSKRTYLQQIKCLCSHERMSPDELVGLSREKLENLVQAYADTYNTPKYSRGTANTVLAVLRSFFESNGFRGQNSLDVEGYYVPTRYRKMAEYVPLKHEIYAMADCAPSLRNKAIILTLYSTGSRNSTLRALLYEDIKDELLKGVSNLKVPVYPEMKRVIPGACKNSLPYYAFTSAEATAAIRLYLQDRADRHGKVDDEAPLFASEYNQVDKEVRSSKFLTSRQIRNIVKLPAKLAGIARWRDVGPHSLRKAFESVIHSETVDGNRLDPKVQEFLMGHILPGSQDNYFDRTRVEEIRLEYSKLRFDRVVIGNRFERLRRVVAEAFRGTEEDPDRLIEEYIRTKKRMRRALGG